MAMLTIRSIEEDLKHRLRVRAARAGPSMYEEARCILRDALANGDDADGLGRAGWGEERTPTMPLDQGPLGRDE